VLCSFIIAFPSTTWWKESAPAEVHPILVALPQIVAAVRCGPGALKLATPARPLAALSRTQVTAASIRHLV